MLELSLMKAVVVIKIGRQEPAISMDNTGKIIWARRNEIEIAILKPGDEQNYNDGERVTLAIKDLGTCELYPQCMLHSPNGRFVVAFGDGEYIILHYVSITKLLLKLLILSGLQTLMNILFGELFQYSLV